MTGCWSDGDLRAWIDEALSEGDRASIEQHLSGCPACAERAQALRARAGRVAMLMNSLAVTAVRPATAWPAGRALWPWGGIPAAIAAGLTLAFILAPRGSHVTPAIPKTAPVSPGGPAAAPPVTAPARAVPLARTRPRRPATSKARDRENGEYYLALDDEPIDTGVVMRVQIDGGMADVIFDSQGRPRAIRPIKQGERQ